MLNIMTGNVIIMINMMDKCLSCSAPLPAHTRAISDNLSSSTRCMKFKEWNAIESHVLNVVTVGVDF